MLSTENHPTATIHTLLIQTVNGTICSFLNAINAHIFILDVLHAINTIVEPQLVRRIHLS